MGQEGPDPGFPGVRGGLSPVCTGWLWLQVGTDWMQALKQETKEAGPGRVAMARATICVNLFIYSTNSFHKYVTASFCIVLSKAGTDI